MRTINILLVCLFVFSTISTVNAQRKGPTEEEIDIFKTRRIAFLTEALQLTPGEAEKFWPVYNQAKEDEWEVQKKRRKIEEQVQSENRNLTDKQITSLIQEMIDTHKAEALLREKYNEKYLDILPPKKVLKLYQAEHQFLRSMLRDFRNRHRGRR